VRALQDDTVMSNDPATKCRSRSRSLASIGGSIPDLRTQRRANSLRQTSVDSDFIPYADGAVSQDNILSEIIEEQEAR